MSLKLLGEQYRISTFSAGSIDRMQSSFHLKLPCTPFVILGMLYLDGELFFNIAFPEPLTSQDKQNYRFYICRDDEKVALHGDNFLGSFRFSFSTFCHIFGPKLGYKDPHIRWMGNPSDPEFVEPEFVLRRLDDPERTSAGMRFEE